ncbi:MAG: hypothetical protein DSY70_07690 [Desulfobulbus sp.]|nr:MAG: hypothetical protein DSY70_07690 [Desulfobulbus sp.]
MRIIYNLLKILLYLWCRLSGIACSAGKKCSIYLAAKEKYCILRKVSKGCRLAGLLLVLYPHVRENIGQARTLGGGVTKERSGSGQNFRGGAVNVQDK